MKNLVLELSEIEKQVSALISENAQLKEKNRVLDCMLTGESLASNERKHQLDKAIELLNRFIDIGDLWAMDAKMFIDLQNDVTKFLHEVGNDYRSKRWSFPS